MSSGAPSSHRLTLDDIADQRAYERERPEFRTRMLEVRRRRRVALGTILTVSFESRDTIRYQIQEMARAEKLSTDEDIQIELDTYNPLIPRPGQLCATLFLELTSDAQMQEWLPKLVGIERHIVLVLADGREVRSVPEAQHATQLTREHVTSAVHYITFEVDASAREGLGTAPVTLVVDHPAYREEAVLSELTVAELLADVTG
ncbi:MAG: uncharacterized protein JWN62_3326 [Acidimicrobiales bacterium]|nr:uncharacterized protein [Acidimicrobiales bacterium]